MALCDKWHACPGSDQEKDCFWGGSGTVLWLFLFWGDSGSGAVGSVAVLVRTVAVPVRFWGGSGEVPGRFLGGLGRFWRGGSGRWVGRGGGEAETECATER